MSRPASSNAHELEREIGRALGPGTFVFHRRMFEFLEGLEAVRAELEGASLPRS